jgi:hypothetical protein
MLLNEEILLFQTQVAAEALKGTCTGSINEEELQIHFDNLIIHKRFIQLFIQQSLNKCQAYIKYIVNNEKSYVKIILFQN